MFGRFTMRFLLPLVFLSATFWPDYGLAWFAVGFAPVYPYAFTILVSIWAILLSLILPLPIRLFRTISTVLVIVSILAGTVSALSAGNAGRLMTPQGGTLYAIVSISIVLGWLIVSTSVWRFLHGIIAVEDQHDHD